jgi:hypothetical protein
MKHTFIYKEQNWKADIKSFILLQCWYPSSFLLNMIIYHPLVMPTFHWFRNKHILSVKHFNILFFVWHYCSIVSFWRERYDDISIIPNHKTQQGNQTMLSKLRGMRGKTYTHVHMLCPNRTLVIKINSLQRIT